MFWKCYKKRLINAFMTNDMTINIRITKKLLWSDSLNDFKVTNYSAIFALGPEKSLEKQKKNI